MSEEQRRDSFNSMFRTTKPKGSGLGLAIVGRIIETHHGEVKIKARPLRGTSISVRLPVA